MSGSRLTFRETVADFLSRSGRRVATGAAILIAGLLGYHAVCGANGISDYQQKRHQYQTLKKDIDVLQQENGRLQDHVQRLRTDPKAIEQAARNVLRYVKPGEVVYAIPATPTR
jgi:cell division protein FtsB